VTTAFLVPVATSAEPLKSDDDDVSMDGPVLVPLNDR
jgi:hypothetical protein